MYQAYLANLYVILRGISISKLNSNSNSEIKILLTYIHNLNFRIFCFTMNYD
jgi:hypothetical protein